MAIHGDLPPVATDVATGAAGRSRGAVVNTPSHSPQAAAGERSRKHDSVEVSEQARLLGKLIQEAKGAPEEREALVAQLRAQVDAGTYTVDARTLAARLLPGLERLG